MSARERALISLCAALEANRAAGDKEMVEAIIKRLCEVARNGLIGVT